MELWVTNGGLVKQDEWLRVVERLRLETPALSHNEKECLELVQKYLVAAVQKRMLPERFGVFLSGGVDSSLLALIARQLHGDFICYTVGFEGGQEAKDVVFARKVAQHLGVSWKLKILSLDEIEKYIKQAVSFMSPVKLVDSVSVGVSAVVMAAVDLAKKDVITTFFGGLGAEEIFGGYQRHLNVADVHAECWRGLKAMWSRDLLRDAVLAKALGITVLTPFLDEDLITAAMRVPGNNKIVDGERKVILRKVAESMGLLKEIAWRRKSAAMYGSNFDKALTKLAKKHGFKEKGDYLKSLRKAF